MKKVWILSEYYYPNDVTTSCILKEIAERLGNKANINVITSSPSKTEGLLFERINNVNIYRVKDSRLDKNNLYKRIIKLILIGLRIFFKTAALVEKDDTVMAVTNPATIIFLMRILRLIKKFKLVYLVHDVFPENLVVAKVLKPDNKIYRLTLALFNWAYSKADRLIVIGRDMESFMNKKLGKKCPAIVFIPNFADVNKIVPQPKKQNKILLHHNLTDKFVLLYTGNIGRAQDIPNILKTMELLKEEDNVHLLIIGDGVNASLVEQFIREKDLHNITLLPSMKREFSNDFLNAGDIGLVSLQAGRKGIAIPSKTYPFLAAAKPILAIVDEGSEVFLMVNESNCGWCSEPGNPIVLKELIYRISQMPDEVNKKGEVARFLAVNKYSIENAIPQFQSNLIE